MNNLLNNINQNGKNLQVNVQVITLDDNLSHPYFSLLDISENNVHPLGLATMEMPYDPQISDYWIKYYGTVIISFNMSDYQYQNTNTEEYIRKFELENKIINPNYNYSLICKVSRFKQKGQKFIVYFENLGWKFLQKVPKDFRTTYVANQSLDNVFQAICEFLGVQFAYSIEDLSKYTFSANGYSVQKEGKTIEDVETVLSRWGQVKDESKTDEEEIDEEQNTDNNQQKNKTTQEKNQDDKSIASDVLNTSEQPTDATTQPSDEIQEKIEKNKEDFENKILDLFRGNTYYESDLVSSVMNYDSITVTPQAPSTTTTDMSTLNNSNTSESNTNNDESTNTGTNTNTNTQNG